MTAQESAITSAPKVNEIEQSQWKKNWFILQSLVTKDV